MKQIQIVFIALSLCLTTQVLVSQESVPRERKFGLGIILGEPTGLSAKYWTGATTAFDFGLGWSVGGDRLGRYKGFYTGGSRIHFHMDHLWHSFDAITSNERFPLYYGIGGRINTGAGYNSSFAIRGVLGIAWMPHDAPADVFLELAPSLQLTSEMGFGIDAGLGARYYF